MFVSVKWFLNLSILIECVSRFPTSALTRFNVGGWFITSVTFSASVSDINEMQQPSCFKQLMKGAFVLECTFDVFTICETVHIAHSPSAG